MLTVIVTSVFEEDFKYCHKFFQMNVCMKYKCQNIIRLIFLKELILTKQMHQKSVTFVIICTFQIKVLNNEPYLCNCCHDLMQKAINFNDVAMVSVKGSDYRIHFWYMSKNDAINIMKNSNLNEKSGSF